MVEDGSRLGWIFGYIGGYFNLLIMASLLVKVVLVALQSVRLSGEPPYSAYFAYLFSMLYFGIMGIWLFSFGSLMKNAQTLKKGVSGSFVLSILSLNVISLVGSLFGLIDLHYYQRTGYLTPNGDLAQPALSPLLR